MIDRPPPRSPAGIQRARYYLGEAFAVEHAPAGAARAAAILILPPLGYEDTSAYRPLRVLADALAGAGHLALRLDWPGLGDSALDDGHPELVARQIAAAAAAAAALRERGFERVIGLGVRAGALLALSVEGLDDVVLWGAPKSGRAYLREERAFHRMAARAYGDAPADRAPLPEGALEAGGFLYNPQTAAALRALQPAAGALGRALVIPREGTAAPAALLSALAERGAEVETSPAGGLGELLENPYHSSLSAAARDAILAWLPADPLARAPGPEDGAERLALPGGGAERPVLLQGGAGEISGVVCEPAGGAGPGAAWTIFFNAGGVRRSGPNRLWTRAARALAASGRPSLRIDVRDVGDSDGATTPHADLEAMYSEASIADAVLAFDWLQDQGAGAIDVVGLCSGAFMGVQVAARRPVRRALLFNGLAFVWDEDARASSMTSHIRGSLLDARRWRRLLTGKIDAVALARSIASRARLAAGEQLARASGQLPASEVARLLRFVRDKGTELQLVSSAGDPSIQYLERQVPTKERPVLQILPGVDHTIRPVWIHARVVDLIARDPAGRRT